MIVKFTGGPLDGLIREMASRDIDAVIVAHRYDPKAISTDMMRWPLTYPEMWSANGIARYRACYWISGSGASLCIEYVYEEN
jgi:hypothetical protein